MTTRRQLVASNVSPWSERARWALDHHRLPFETIAHVPMLGERRLRKLAARAAPGAARAPIAAGRKLATVPMLLEGERVLCESWDIVVHADATGSGTRLVPPAHEPAIRAFTATADAAMESCRPLVVAALMKSPRALDETAPAFVPALLRPLLRSTAKNGTAWFARKYGLDLDDVAGHTARVRDALVALRSSLAAAPASAPAASSSSPALRYLLGEFTYADVVMALVLQGVQPVADRHMPIGPATRGTWTLPSLAAEFADLIAWRDAVYGAHRARSV